MVKNAQDTSLVQAPSGLWLPRQAQNTSQPHPIQTPSPLSTQEPPQKQTQSSTQQQPWPEKTLAGKTLWEWMSLLLIPLLVGIGTIAVTWQQTITQNALSDQQYRSAQEIARQARFDDLLKNYRDGINTLILEKSLKTSPFGSDVRSIAHSQTLDILRLVDADRKGSVIAYLANLGLIQGAYPEEEANDVRVSIPMRWHQTEPIISLSDADLSGADLREICPITILFERIGVWGKPITKIFMKKTSSSGFCLSGADLRSANLKSANLRNTDLTFVDLVLANLAGADLSSADLRGAENTTPGQISQAKSLSGTFMPDGTKQPCKPNDLIYCQ